MDFNERRYREYLHKKDMLQLHIILMEDVGERNVRYQENAYSAYKRKLCCFRIVTRKNAGI